MRNLLLTIMLLSIAGIFLLFWLAQPEVFMKKTNYSSNAIDRKFDSYMLSISMLEFSKEGKRASKIEAANTSYFKESNRIKLNKPKLTYYQTQDSTRPWYLKADKGETANDGKNIIFRKDVCVWKYLANGDKSELKTEKLTLYPKTHTVKTDRKVKMISPNGESVGIGMEGNLDTEVFKLLSDVQGIIHGR